MGFSSGSVMPILARDDATQTTPPDGMPTKGKAGDRRVGVPPNGMLRDGKVGNI